MYEDCGEGAPGEVMSEMSCKGKKEFLSQRKYWGKSNSTKRVNTPYRNMNWFF